MCIRDRYAAEDKKIQYSILTDPTARVTAQQEGSTLVMELVTADAVDQLDVYKRQVFG